MITSNVEKLGFDCIPTYLKDRQQWVVWKYENRNGKLTKVPYQVNNRPAKSNVASTWTDFETCQKAFNTGKFSGIGFVFAEGDGLVGIDLDHCYDADGQLEPWASSIVNEFNDSYIERSPSGDGSHIWCFGSPIKTGLKKWKKEGTELEQGIEVYNYKSPRYFTVTGNVMSKGGY